MDALEILADYVRVFHVARHGENSWNDRIRESYLRGEYHC